MLHHHSRRSIGTSGNPVSTAANSSGMASVTGQTIGRTAKTSKVRLTIYFIDSSWLRKLLMVGCEKEESRSNW